MTISRDYLVRNSKPCSHLAANCPQGPAAGLRYASTMSSLAARDRACIWHPFTQMKTAPEPLPIVRGDGPYLITDDGRRVLDGISSWWVNVHGHCNPKVNRALQAQAERLEHVMFAGCTHPPAVELAERLRALLPSRLKRVFFSDNGSTAVEVALKMAYQYWTNRGETQRRTFLALEHAYHGDTVGAMSASHASLFTASYAPLLFRVERAAVPRDYLASMDPDKDGGATEPLREIEALLERRGAELAAVIVEPMLQAAGGMIVCKPAFLRRLRKLCDAYGLLLIADEVMTGFGRTGPMFACEHGPVQPDLICLSKGLSAGYLPLAVTVASEKVYEAFLSEDRRKTFFHGHSFTANPLGCAAALAGLDIFAEDDVLERIQQISKRMRERLASFVGRSYVRDVRQIGGVGILELETAREGYLADIGPRLAAAFLQRNLLLRPNGNIVYFMPPYVVGDEQIDWVFDQIDDVVSALLGHAD